MSNNKGVSLVIIAVAMTLIMVCAALAVDVGAAATGRAGLSEALDAAALAGAQEYISNKPDTESVVKAYAEKNTDNISEITTRIDEDTRTVEVHGVKQQKSFFARIFGFNVFNISVTAAAKIENISAINGARPLAVVQQTFKYGAVYTLKEGGGSGNTGNYAAITLGGTGGSVYRDNLLNGYSGTIKVGDQIATETGNIAGTTETCITQLVKGCTHNPPCTYDYYNSNCTRIIFLPVVNTLTVNGKKYVKVMGFATFFLEGVTDHAGQADVIGRFITYNMNGQTSSSINDYGTYGIRLVK